MNIRVDKRPAEGPRTAEHEQVCCPSTSGLNLSLSPFIFSKRKKMVEKLPCPLGAGSSDGDEATLAGAEGKFSGWRIVSWATSVFPGC